MSTPKLISDTGLSPEQEQALVLARARKRRAEAEAAKPAPVASKAPPAPVAKPGPAVPASGMGAMGSRAPADAAAYAATVPQPVYRPDGTAVQSAPRGFDMAPSSPQARRDMVGATPPQTQPMAAAPGAQYSWTPPAGMGDPASFADARARMDAAAKAEADRVAAEAKAAREAQLAAERREASRAYGAGMDMIISTDDQGQLRPGSGADADGSKGILTSPQHGANAVIQAAESGLNLWPDALNGVFRKLTGSGNGLGNFNPDIVPRFSLPKVPIPEGMESFSGSIGEGLAQFLLSRKLVGSVAPGGGLAANLGKDAVAVGVGFDGSTGRMADMFDLNAIPEGPLRDYARFLQTQPDDSPIVGRFKNMLEDMTMSGPMLAPQSVVRAGQAVGNALTPKPMTPANAGGAGVQAAMAQSRVAPQVSPVQAPPAAQAAPEAPQAPPASPGAVPPQQGPAGAAQGATQPPPVQPPPAAPVGMAVPPPATATQAASSAEVQLPTLTRAEKRAADILIKRLEADGVSWDDVKRVAASMGRRGDSGVYETIGELVAYVDGSSGANMRGLQMAGGTIPGATQERIVGRVAENDKLLPKRVTRAGTRATGQMAENAVDTLQALNQRLRTESGPRYETFYSAPVDPRVFANEVLPIIDTEAGQIAARQALTAIRGKEARLRARVSGGKASAGQTRELEHAAEAARSLGAYLREGELRALVASGKASPDDIAELGQLSGPQIPSPYALNRIKRAFDNQIEAAGQGSEIAKDIRGTKTDFADGVSNATGGKYGEALGFYEGNKRLRTAFDFGNGALTKKSWQLKLEMDEGLQGRAWSGGEIEAIAMGVARQIEDMIEANDQRALTMLIKGKALENLATALGDPKAAARFEQSMRRLAANREWGRRVAKGSDTAMRQASVAEMATEADDAVLRNLDRMDKTQTPPTPFGLGWDLLVSPIIRGAKDSYQRFRYAGLHDPEVNKILAPILGDAATPETLKAADRIISARLAEKAQKQGPVAIGYGSPPKPKPAAPSAKPAPKAKRSPTGNKLKAPGKPPANTGGKKPPQSNSPAFIGSSLASGVGAGGVTYAATGDEELAMKVGIGAGLAGGVLGNRLSKMGGSKPKAVKPPPGVRVDASSNVQRGPWKPGAPRPKPPSAGQERRARLQELREMGITAKQARQIDDMSPESIKGRGQASPDFQRGVQVATLRGQKVPDAEIARQLGVTEGVEELDRLEELVGAYDWGHPAIRPEFYAGTPSALKPSEIMELRQRQAKRETVTPFRKPPPGGGVKPPPVGAKAGAPPFKLVEGAEVIDTSGWTPAVFNSQRAELNKMLQERPKLSGQALAELDSEITSLRNALDPPIAPEFADVPMASRFNAPVEQPWPKGSPADTAIKKAIEGKNWTVQSVPLAKVIPTQDSVFFDYAKAAGRYAGDDRLPIVVKQGDQYFVADGHHRLMAQGGADQVRARVIDLAPSKGPGGKPPPGTKLSAFPGADEGSKLPMDEASRMQRARGMGFDVDAPLYHGTNADFDEFRVSEDGNFGPGVYLTRNPRDASQYAGATDGANVRPVYIRGRLADEEAWGDAIESASQKSPNATTEEWDRQAVAMLKKQGYAGIDGDGQISIFDPSNIRGKFAKFDPSQEGSSKLLSAFPGGTAAQAASGAGGAYYGWKNPVDANEDGVIDDQDRAITATTLGLGGLTAAGLARNALSRGPRGVKPSPASNAFGGGKGKPKPEPRPVLGGRVIKQVQQAAKSLPPEVRNKLAANAQLPAGARKSAVEAAGDDPSIYRMAAPFQNAKPGPIMRQAERVPTITGKSAFPRPANPIDEGVNASLDRIERNVGPPRSLDPIAEAAGIAERRRRAAVAEASRWNAKVNTQTREAQGLPDMPVPKALARNEQEATELAIAAKRALAAANLETTSAQEARAWAEQRKEAIIEALLGQSDGAKPVGVMATRMQVGGASSKTPPVRPPKPVSYQDARDMAELLFDADNAKMLDDVLSGRVKPKNRDDHHMALLMLGGATGLGITGLAIANDAPERTPPKDNYDPQQYMTPGDPRYVWDWDKMKTNRQAVQAIQVNLNALPPNADGARYNLSVDAWGKKTEAALKHWQYENRFNPDGAMTAEQWELLDSQALAARRNEPARTGQRR